MKVYTYGAKAPRAESMPVVREQLSRAHKYYNNLIELYRARRVATDEARRKHFPDYDDISNALEVGQQEYDAARAEVSARNAKERRKSGTQEDRERLKGMAGRLKDLRARRKAMREAMAGDAGFQAANAEIWNTFTATKKESRATCGVYWGTYLRIENAAEKANETALAGPPRFRRWTGDGVLGVQCQGGLQVEDCMFGSDTRLQIEPLPTTRTGRSARPHLVRFRVASTDKGKPVWCEIMIYLHRPLPPKGIIKEAAIVVRRVGTKDHWQVQFTVAGDEPKPCAPSGMVGVDLGWRLFDDGSLRAAAWVGDDGESGEVRIPKEVMRRRGKTRSLQAIRDKSFDAIKAQLGEWMRTHESPEWLRDRLKFLGQWRSQGRLASVAFAWRDQRFTNDETIYADVESWRKQDAHLYDWQAHNQRRFAAQRKEIYRVFAAALAKRYRHIVVEDCDWRKLARKPSPESAKTEQGEREYQREGAVGSLRLLLGQSGAVTIKAPSGDTTRTCHVCDSLEDFDQANDLTHICRKCGAVWDQDVNAAKNLLARGKVMAENLGVARETESEDGVGDAEAKEKRGRWAKRKKDRLSQNGTESGK